METKNKSIKVSEWIVKNLIWFILSITFIVIGIFACQFKSQNYSEDISHWGNFGDYFGGILNPIFAIINILILYYLTSYLRKREENDLLFEFRYSFYKELCEFMDFMEKDRSKKIPIAYILSKINVIENSIFLFFDEKSFLQDLLDNIRKSSISYKNLNLNYAIGI